MPVFVAWIVRDLSQGRWAACMCTHAVYKLIIEAPVGALYTVGSLGFMHNYLQQKDFSCLARL